VLKIEGKTMKKDFEILPHTADLKIHVYGTTLEELFKHALIGMFQSIGPKSKACTKKGERLYCSKLTQNHDISVDAPDRDALLVNFLSEALSLSDINNEAYLDVTIHELNENHIRATLHGIPIEGFEVVEIKAVTYHELAIQKIDGVWQSDIVFDI
jgi:SHS2 domain-containing protein